MTARGRVTLYLDNGKCLIASCEREECPNEGTHVVIYNPVGHERLTKYYCETHAEAAANEAVNGSAGDLFLGPKPFE